MGSEAKESGEHPNRVMDVHPHNYTAIHLIDSHSCHSGLMFIPKRKLSSSRMPVFTQRLPNNQPSPI
jgi:hypothetical protein